MKNIKPIAMKCTEEQFGAIKPILKENGLIVYQITNFEDTPYLVNNVGEEVGSVSNVSLDLKNSYGRTVFEEWNQDTFLEYCGIKLEKQTEKTMGYKLKVPITDVLEIHNVACVEWKRKIKTDYLVRMNKEQEITFTEDEIDTMFLVATEDQKPVLTKIFGEKKKEIDYDKLKTGSRVLIKYTGQHCSGIENINTNEPVDIIYYKTEHTIHNNRRFYKYCIDRRYITFHQNGNYTVFLAEKCVDYITEVIEY